MSTVEIADNIAKLRLRVRLSAEKIQRRPEEITVLAVSKTRPVSDILEAYRCGLTEFGESYLQEAVAKVEALAELPLCWHFIGPIQSNKTRPIATHFDWVHSVDRLKIARRLSAQRPAGKPPLQVCLQVNISGEESKSGVSLAALPELALAVAELPALQLRGLMAIPAASDEEQRQRQSFARLRLALEETRALLARAHTETSGAVASDAVASGVDTLSMGMSGDLEAAIAEGSTLVRIGTDIFGARS